MVTGSLALAIVVLLFGVLDIFGTLLMGASIIMALIVACLVALVRPVALSLNTGIRV